MTVNQDMDRVIERHVERFRYEMFPPKLQELVRVNSRLLDKLEIRNGYPVGLYSPRPKKESVSFFSSLFQSYDIEEIRRLQRGTGGYRVGSGNYKAPSPFDRKR